MENRILEALAQFCVDQHANFDPQAWLCVDWIDQRILAVTARYLSLTSWYGLETDLELVAESLLPGIAERQQLNNELHGIATDIPYLSASIRYRLATRKLAERLTPGLWSLAGAPGSYRSALDLQGLD